MRINVEMLEIAGLDSPIYPTLTWDDDHLVLIDAGFPGQMEAIMQAIAQAGFYAGCITHIIITHQDLNHIGCVMDILQLAPVVLVLAHADEAPYLDGRKTPIKLAVALEQYDCLPAEMKEWCDRMKAGYSKRKIIIGQALSDGDVLPICDGIQVIHTPGHTPGHICLLLQKSGVLVSGDALNIVDNATAGPNPRHTYDMALGLRSMEKAQKYPFSAMVAYHGGYLQVK